MDLDAIIGFLKSLTQGPVVELVLILIAWFIRSPFTPKGNQPMLERIFAIVGQVLAILIAVLAVAEDLFDESKSMEERKIEVMKELKVALTKLAAAIPAASPVIMIFTHDALLDMLVDKLLPQAEKLRLQLEGPAPENP